MIEFQFWIILPCWFWLVVSVVKMEYTRAKGKANLLKLVLNFDRIVAVIESINGVIIVCIASNFCTLQIGLLVTFQFEHTPLTKQTSWIFLFFSFSRLFEQWSDFHWEMKKKKIKNEKLYPISKLHEEIFFFSVGYKWKQQDDRKGYNNEKSRHIIHVFRNDLLESIIYHSYIYTQTYKYICAHWKKRRIRKKKPK